MTQKPLHIILASDERSSFVGFIETLQAQPALIVKHVGSPRQAEQEIQAGHVDVLVVDESVDGVDGLQFVRDMTYRFPLVNCALVSPLPPSDFHEKTEGLGLFMQLPHRPGTEDAAQMIEIIGKIYGLLENTTVTRSQS